MEALPGGATAEHRAATSLALRSRLIEGSHRNSDGWQSLGGESPVPWAFLVPDPEAFSNAASLVRSDAAALPRGNSDYMSK
jgi:hypothetical protein